MQQTNALGRTTIALPTIATSRQAFEAPLASIFAAGLVLTLAAHRDLQITQAWEQKVTLSATTGTVPITPIAAMPTAPAPKRSLGRRARIEKLLAQVAEDEWALTPPDLSANIDTIVYG